METTIFKNPYRPGAGHCPPHLAGREKEKNIFSKLLDQDIIIKNLILTGLRGTGKTVLLETFKPICLEKTWLWAGADLSESASVSEENIAIRLLTDLSVITSDIVISMSSASIGFESITDQEPIKLDYRTLVSYYAQQAGLTADKLKATLEWAWSFIKQNHQIKGVVFAYDEAQNMSDNADERQYPLSVLLDVFQTLQRKEIPFLLVFVGLPTLLPKLVETRTYSERMFEVIQLKSLSKQECQEAIERPLANDNCPVRFGAKPIQLITERSGGYPYFIQFICREAFDSFLSQVSRGVQYPSVPMDEIHAKLETEFFSGRWDTLTDRQRDLLFVVANLQKNEDGEFTVQDVVEYSKKLTTAKSFNNSHVNQMFNTLSDRGLVYKSRHGKYTFGIPLLERYIQQQREQ